MAHWLQCTSICLTFHTTHQQFTFDSTNCWTVYLTIKWNRTVVICERYEVATAALELSFSYFADLREDIFWMTSTHIQRVILSYKLIDIMMGCVCTKSGAVACVHLSVDVHAISSLTSRQWVITTGCVDVDVEGTHYWSLHKVRLSSWASTIQSYGSERFEWIFSKESYYKMCFSKLLLSFHNC